jgi:hypothetical protein
MGSNGGLTPGQTSQLTVGRKITLTLTFSQSVMSQYRNKLFLGMCLEN